MNIKPLNRWISAVSLMLLLVWGNARWSAVALDERSPTASTDKPSAGAAKEGAASQRPSREEARLQAQVLHSAMHAALQHVHHEYYEEDQGLRLPAAVMKDVFAEVEKEQQIKFRWLAVEGQAMNADHKAKSAFEEEAVKALTAGQKAFEKVEDGFYRRAGAITLTNHCLKCHVPDRKSTANRTAGLIISVPIRKD